MSVEFYVTHDQPFEQEFEHNSEMHLFRFSPDLGNREKGLMIVKQLTHPFNEYTFLVMSGKWTNVTDRNPSLELSQPRLSGNIVSKIHDFIIERFPLKR
jgi:hypothetical protein